MTSSHSGVIKVLHLTEHVAHVFKKNLKRWRIILIIKYPVIKRIKGTNFYKRKINICFLCVLKDSLCSWNKIKEHSNIVNVRYEFKTQFIVFLPKDKLQRRIDSIEYFTNF